MYKSTVSAVLIISVHTVCTVDVTNTNNKQPNQLQESKEDAEETVLYSKKVKNILVTEHLPLLIKVLRVWKARPTTCNV